MPIEAKPFASLSSGLLARKGAARPAMRPQGFGQGGAGLEDLGWNDMGFEPPKPSVVARDTHHDAFGDDVVEHPRSVHATGLTPVQSPVHSQHAELADRFSADTDEDQGVDNTSVEAEPVHAEPIQAEPVEAAPVAAAPVPAAPLAIVAPVRVPLEVVPSAAPAPRREPRPRAVAGSKPKAAFTLRLDPARHLKLRLACAVNGRSAQQLVTDALDGLLQSMPELDSMAAKANRKR